MRLKLLLILGPILVIAGLGMNATMGQNKDDDPPKKDRPKDDRKEKDDRKGGPKDDRKGGPKDDGPPHDGRHGPDLRRLIDDLDLTDAQQTKVRKVMDVHQEKMRVVMEKANRDLLAQLKKVLPAAQYRKLEEEIQRRPKGPPKKDRKGPKEDGKDDDDGKGPPKKDRKGPPKDDQEAVGITERISAPRLERDGDQ